MDAIARGKAGNKMDLGDVVIVNESPSVDVIGDVCAFRTRQRACKHLEPVDVERGEYHAISASGRLLDLTTDGQRVTISERLDASLDVVMARALLLTLVRPSERHRIDNATPLDEVIKLVQFLA